MISSKILLSPKRNHNKLRRRNSILIHHLHKFLIARRKPQKDNSCKWSLQKRLNNVVTLTIVWRKMCIIFRQFCQLARSSTRSKGCLLGLLKTVFTSYQQTLSLVREHSISELKHIVKGTINIIYSFGMKLDLPNAQTRSHCSTICMIIKFLHSTRSVTTNCIYMGIHYRVLFLNNNLNHQLKHLQRTAIQCIISQSVTQYLFAVQLVMWQVGVRCTLRGRMSQKVLKKLSQMRFRWSIMRIIRKLNSRV